MGRSAQWSTKRTSALLSRGKTIAIPLKVLHNKWHYKSNITPFHLWCNWYVRTIDHHENFNKVTDKFLRQNICLYHPPSCFTVQWHWNVNVDHNSSRLDPSCQWLSAVLQCCSAACVTTMTGECWHLHARYKNQEPWIDEDRGWITDVTQSSELLDPCPSISWSQLPSLHRCTSMQALCTLHTLLMVSAYNCIFRYCTAFSHTAAQQHTALTID